MVIDHTDRVALVTGATGGLGIPLVSQLVEQKYRVIAVGRSHEKLTELPEEVMPVIWDMSTHSEAPEILLNLKRVDVVVQNAGMADVASVASTSSDLWDTMFRVNVSAPAKLTTAILPGLRAAQGHAIFINAAPKMSGVPNWSGYVASKAAQREFADSLREEESRNGIRVTSIYPKGTATRMLEKVRESFGASYDPNREINPASMATMILSVLDHPADAYARELSVGKPGTS